MIPYPKLNTKLGVIYIFFTNISLYILNDKHVTLSARKSTFLLTTTRFQAGSIPSIQL